METKEWVEYLQLFLIFAVIIAVVLKVWTAIMPFCLAYAIADMIN